MEIAELETNLALYRAQLQHLEDLPADGDREKDMQILRDELKELISLTEEALLTSKKQELLAMLQSSDSTADCASTSVAVNQEDQPTASLEANDEEDDTLFDELVGTQCSAIFRTSNGTVRRLNAVVFDVDQYSQRCSLFCCTPTERRLVPCRFFLADRCAFDSQTCRYSHGYETQLDELTEYVEPDFSVLRSGLRCLARRAPVNPSCSSGGDGESGTEESADAELWQEAMVERVQLSTLTCIVRLSSGTCETVPFVNIFPLVEYVVELSDSDSSEEQSEDQDAVIEVSSAGEPVRRKRRAEAITIEISDDEEDEVRFVGITKNETCTGTDESLSTKMKVAAATSSSVGFGSWERYTSGIGSKLLRRMGYVEGRGLGAGGEGRVEPVPIEVLPNGRTLDEIMRLKAAANDHQLFNVSATFGCDAADGARLDLALRRIRKLSFGPSKSGHSLPRAKARRIRNSAANNQGDSGVFAFINRRIQEHGPPIAKQGTKLSQKQLHRRSDRELNVEGLQYERKLRELDAQIVKQEATVSRIGSASGALATQARDRLAKLRALREETRIAMRRLENHQEARKQNAKFATF